VINYLILKASENSEAFFYPPTQAGSAGGGMPVRRTMYYGRRVAFPAGRITAA